MDVERGGGGFRPYFDPDYESFDERINPPRVCVDNNSCDDCTLVRVDSANKHGILLEMVQVLTDLDLNVPKSYISSDGGWFMDVFHVTDEMGNKITDAGLVRYIQQSMMSRTTRKRVAMDGEVATCSGRVVDTRLLPEETTSIEVTAIDRPGLLSSISAVLAELDCNVVSAMVWSHDSHVAMILYLTEEASDKPISDQHLLLDIEDKVRNVVRANHEKNERWNVRLVRPTKAWVHTERRLHQLMQADHELDGMSDDEECCTSAREKRGLQTTTVSIDYCWEKGYSVVYITSKDRPKLLFDTVCTLTDMSYNVSHATISSKGPLSHQEYFIRRMDGCALISERERKRVSQCVSAAIERRPSQGLRFNICTGNRTGLLSDVTRVFREQGLSIRGAEISTRRGKASGMFFVTLASGEDLDTKTVESVKKEIGGTAVLEVGASPIWSFASKLKSSMSMPTIGRSCGRKRSEAAIEQGSRFSLGSLLWSGIGRFSFNFGSL